METEARLDRYRDADRWPAKRPLAAMMELRPTFGWPEERLACLLAGGEAALVRARGER